MSVFLTVHEVSRLTGRSEPSIRYLITKGELPAEQFGPRQRLRIPADAVERLGAGDGMRKSPPSTNRTA